MLLVEELQEKLDMFDYRLLDVESKVEDLEKAQSVVEETLRNDAARLSRASHANCEAQVQLEGIEHRVSDLEASAMSSIRRPWTVEVVATTLGALTQRHMVFRC